MARAHICVWYDATKGVNSLPRGKPPSPSPKKTRKRSLQKQTVGILYLEKGSAKVAIGNVCGPETINIELGRRKEGRYYQIE